MAEHNRYTRFLLGVSVAECVKKPHYVTALTMLTGAASVKLVLRHVDDISAYYANGCCRVINCFVVHFTEEKDFCSYRLPANNSSCVCQPFDWADAR